MHRKRLRDASSLFAVCILGASRNQRVKKMHRKRLRDASSLFAVCILGASRNQRVKKMLRKLLRDSFTLPEPQGLLTQYSVIACLDKGQKT
ncbi:hypothetical protein PoB_001816300 [Plakobranchus ocellatus]|uniref:Uncharacterized protein n=1 Tax=Plakobranchus ocellatus TaxID=259542 RepID=A0AAV3ZB60_9GAST|nr:hypothetical protein PoB_001816300 [Plakobranchus ocellatus]